MSQYCDSTGLNNTHQGRMAAHERSARPIATKSTRYFMHTPYCLYRPTIESENK